MLLFVEIRTRLPTMFESIHSHLYKSMTAPLYEQMEAINLTRTLTLPFVSSIYELIRHLSYNPAMRFPSSKKVTQVAHPIPRARDVSDPQRAPGRIIGMAAPLPDFKNTLEGDVVSKAMEDLGWVLKRNCIASIHRGAARECLTSTELREVCRRTKLMHRTGTCAFFFIM